MWRTTLEVLAEARGQAMGSAPCVCDTCMSLLQSAVGLMKDTSCVPAHDPDLCGAGPVPKTRTDFWHIVKEATARALQPAQPATAPNAQGWAHANAHTNHTEHSSDAHSTVPTHCRHYTATHFTTTGCHLGSHVAHRAPCSVLAGLNQAATATHSRLC